MLARAMPQSDNSFFQSLTLSSEADTEALGRRVAALLAAGDTITLAGVLGAGKTVLARAVIRTFLPGAEVPSPTFTLVQTYDTKRFPIWHVDLYRVKALSEVRELGLDDVAERGVLVIEWPDRMAAMLPANRLDIVFEGGDEGDERTVKIVARGDWAARIGHLSV